MTRNILLFTFAMTTMLLIPTVASAQSRTCSKCGKSIAIRNYATHISSCKGKVTPPTSSGNTYNTPQTKSFTVKGVTFTMVGVQGGTFMMSGNHYYNEPDRRTSISSFYIGKYEVTQELWQAVMGDNPSENKGDLKRPVENMSWEECEKFFLKLNAITGQKFRFPSEKEWEYAAKGGQRSKGYKFSGSNSIKSVAWYEGNSGGTTHPVGQKQPNELGIYDMTGNVWEWVDGGNEGSSVRGGDFWMSDDYGIRERYDMFGIIGLRLAL